MAYPEWESLRTLWLLHRQRLLEYLGASYSDPVPVRAQVVMLDWHIGDSFLEDYAPKNPPSLPTADGYMRTDSGE